MICVVFDGCRCPVILLRPRILPIYGLFLSRSEGLQPSAVRSLPLGDIGCDVERLNVHGGRLSAVPTELPVLKLRYIFEPGCESAEEELVVHATISQILS